MYFAQHQYTESPSAPMHGDDLLPERTALFDRVLPQAQRRLSVSFGRSLGCDALQQAGRNRVHWLLVVATHPRNRSHTSAGAAETFSLASFSRDCYIAAMSDGQSG